jgi:cation diffusion facilitator family transporter
MKKLAFPAVGAEAKGVSPALTRFAWLSIVAAILTIILKTGAYLITGSVGLLSEAAESLINLVAAIVALTALKVAAKPADDNHHYGHGKAEYFSAGLEGLMIFIAAGIILVTSVQRLLHPVALESLGIGLAISTVGSLINAVVGAYLIQIGRQHRSVTLVADGKHLLTDVWTSVGVIVGVLLVWITGWQRLDAIVAGIVGINILVTGYRLVSQSVVSLLDAAMPADDIAAVTAILNQECGGETAYAGLRTRVSGRHRFISFTVHVPPAWTVEQGHELVSRVAKAITAAVSDSEVHAQLQPTHTTAGVQPQPV